MSEQINKQQNNNVKIRPVLYFIRLKNKTIKVRENSTKRGFTKNENGKWKIFYFHGYLNI